VAVGLFNFDTRWTDAKFVRLAYYLPTFEFGSFGCNLEGHLFQNVACATAHGGRLCVDPKAGSLLVLAIMGPFGPDWFLHEADWLSQAPRCSIFASQKKKSAASSCTRLFGCAAWLLWCKLCLFGSLHLMFSLVQMMKNSNQTWLEGYGTHPCLCRA